MILFDDVVRGRYFSFRHRSEITRQHKSPCRLPESNGKAIESTTSTCCAAGPYPALLAAVDVELPDGSTQDAAAYLAANADVTIDFQPSFRNVLDLTATPPTCSGFGITINNENGEIRVPAPPTRRPSFHNFLLHATAQDSSDDKEYRISVRIHLHNRVTSAWLTPPILTFAA